MNKKFVKWQLRQWLPTIIVFAVFLASVFLSSCLYSSVYAYASEYGGVQYIYQYPETNLLSIYIPSLILTFVMPCFVYHFRYRRESADFYRQAPEKEGSIRRHKMLIGLIILLVVISVAFWLGFLLMIVRFSVAVPPRSAYSRGAMLYNLYFGYYPLAWLYLLLFVAAQYCINCFLMSMAGTLLDGILLMIVAQIFLNGLFEFPLIMIYEIIAIPMNGSVPNWMGDFSQVLVLFPGVGVVEPVVFGYRLFEPLIQKNATDVVSGNGLFDFVTFGSLALYFLGAGACGYLSFKGKEPSGEYFGKSGPRKPIYALPIYLAGAASAFLVPILSAIGMIVNFVLLLFFATLFFTLWALGYFVILVIFHRSFRIGKTALIAYGVTIAVCFLLVIFFSIYNRSNSLSLYNENSAYAEYIRLIL